MRFLAVSGLALMLVGCAAASGKPREIALVAGPVPAGYAVIGQAEGYDADDLKDQARARGGDAITTPTLVGLRGQMQSDILRRN